MLIHEMWSRRSPPHSPLAARPPPPCPPAVRDLGEDGKMKRFAGEHGVHRS